ncbi:MAG: hypothetical protein NTX50_13745 [Candidatus Sumerlaeota bacterium]|nr:hypothetical protein [Candidatus Sumerlaeota bacterium]
MAMLLIKGIGPKVYETLRTRARRSHRTVSQEAKIMIQERLEHSGMPPREATEAFLKMAGAWQDDRSAAAIICELKKARRSESRAKHLANVFD